MSDDQVMQYGQVPVDDTHQTVAQAYRSEVVILREIVRRYCRHDQTPPWMNGSACADVYGRALAEDSGVVAWPVDGDVNGIAGGW